VIIKDSLSSAYLFYCHTSNLN